MTSRIWSSLHPYSMTMERGFKRVPTGTPEIWITWGDSEGVGIDARDPTIDINWPNVQQYRSRAPVGITSVITPLDQMIAPTGTSYLSSTEYFAKARAATINAPVVICANNWNGTQLGGTTWGPGQSDSNTCISNANAAIQAFLQMYPNGKVGGMIEFIGTNDSNTSNAMATTWPSTLNSCITDLRTKIFQNGVSGADMTTLPYIIEELIPEWIGLANKCAWQQTLRKQAATMPNGKIYRVPEGLNRTDMEHPTAAGMRVIGAGQAALLTDTTPPVHNLPANYTSFAGQNMLIQLTANKTCFFSLPTNDPNYEIIWLSDGTSGIGLSRMSQYLRWLNDATGVAGTYSTTITATDQSGNQTNLTRTDTVLAAYGSQVGTVTETAGTLFSGANTPDLKSRNNVPVTLNAGMNIIIINKNSGGATDISDVSFNGIHATRDANSGSGTWLYYLPAAQAMTGNLVITPTSSSIANICVSIITLTGTVATPTSSSVVPYAIHTTPHLSGSLTCPANGVIAGGGLISGIGTATSGETELARSGAVFCGYRTTNGSLGATGNNNAYSCIVAAAFAKA